MNPRCLFPLALAIALGLPACSQKEQSHSGRIRVTYNCAANASDINQLQKQLSAFADSTGIEIALQPFTGQDKLYAMMAAGQPPDIFYTNTVIRDHLAAEGRLLDMRTVSANDPFVARLWPDVYRQGLISDSGLYSIGNWSFTAGVYYNKDLFDRAGLHYPDTSWSWSDLVSAARRLTIDSNKDGQPEQYGVFIPSHFVEVFELMNGAPLREKSLFLHFSDASLEVFRQYVGLMNDHFMPDLRRVQAMGMQASQLLQTPDQVTWKRSRTRCSSRHSLSAGVLLLFRGLASIPSAASGPKAGVCPSALRLPTPLRRGKHSLGL